MKTINIGKNEIQLYSGVKELPIKLYNQMQSLLLQDSGIGSTMADIDKHFQNLDALLQSGNLQDANIERQNMHLAFYSAIEKINYNSLAFACLVFSINDKPVIDYSDEGLKTIISKLSDLGLNQGLLVELLDDLKKNCRQN